MKTNKFWSIVTIFVLTLSATIAFSSCNKNEDGINETGNGGTNKGHEYVDLGLPSGTLWATCNVGASNPEDYGLYFAWGETKGYAKRVSHSFDWTNYKWSRNNGIMAYMTKYCTDSEYGTVDNKTILDPQDDAATANWGSGWRMPSLQEIKDLYDNKYTTVEWVTVNGVNGSRITSKSNGNSIFLPAAGSRSDTDLYNEGHSGYYWSREREARDASAVYSLCVGSYGYIKWAYRERCEGLLVRPVRKSSE